MHQNVDLAKQVEEIYEGKPVHGVRRGEVGVSYKAQQDDDYFSRKEVRWNHEGDVRGSNCSPARLKN